MANILQMIPNLGTEEMYMLEGLTKEMSDPQAQQFAGVYIARRRDPQTVLILIILGFLGIAGIQRFLLDQIGMGILYLLTGGLCLIGTIVDLVNYQRLAFEYNQRVAHQVSGMIKQAG